jgi:hypothetical protein
VKKTAVVLTAVLTAGVAGCSSGVQPRPKLEGGVSATCMLSWTYESARSIPEYPSFAAAYKADMAEYGHQSTPGYVYEIMPVLEPVVRITVRSSVNVGGVEVVFYDNSGAEAHQNTQVAVNKVIAGGHSYTADTAVDVWGLSDPETGDTNVVSCAVAAWTRRG